MANRGGSGKFSAVKGCHNSYRKLKRFLDQDWYEHKPTIRAECKCPRPFKVHKMPSDGEGKRQWLAALNLKCPSRNVHVCSFHSVDRQPTTEKPYPELWLRYDRPLRKKRRRRYEHKASVPSPKQSDVDDHSCTSKNVASVGTQWEDHIFEEHCYIKRQHIVTYVNQSTQCDTFKPPTLMNDYDSNLYTGLPLHTFHTLTEIEQQILLTLMKLKLNLLIEDLAIRFHISVSKVSRIISFWIDTMTVVFKGLIPWLPKETIKATTPEAYKQHYPNVTCILDCSESEVRIPGNLDSRSESYSHYYTCNTIKYLVAIAPCGLVMFISAVYGGRCSDKFITCDSGILEYLHPGDEVMVDRGFLIRDLLFERQVNVIIPHFANKMQLTEEKVTCSCRIANVRIHVERAIRRLKVYKVLSQTLPITLMPKIDQILRISAALVNLRGDLIREADN
uniref:THAP-type domain-containing protein n=1 Tax=Sinocyclocheilus grahami TaxID=75366 RepID=A0A672PN14_SINGR